MTSQSLPIAKFSQRSKLLHELRGMALVSLAVIGLCYLLLQTDPNYFWRDDYQTQHLPAYADIFRAWSEGRFPLLSPYSWFGGNLAGEYQYGVFSVFMTAVVLIAFKLHLALPTTAAFIVMVHLAVLASGGFVLARGRHLQWSLAMIVGLVAALNGYMLCWGAITWTPALTSFAWLPWAWWGLEFAATSSQGLWRVIPAGIFVYLLVAAGWPFSVLMLLVISTWLCVKEVVSQRRFRPLLSMGLSLSMGFGLAAPAVLCLVEYSDAVARASVGSGRVMRWIVPRPAFLATILPSYPAEWLGFGSTTQIKPSLELTGGVVPTIFIGQSLFYLRRRFLREFAWDILLLLIFFILCTSPGWGSFRWSFRWLPALHLVLVLLAAQGMQRVYQRPRVSKQLSWRARLLNNPGVWMFVGVCVVWLVAMLQVPDFRELSIQLAYILMVLAISWSGAYIVLSRYTALVRWMPFMVTWLVLLTTYARAPVGIVIPEWNIPSEIQSAEGWNQDVRYFSLYQSRDVAVPQSASRFGTTLRPGNLGMYAGVELVQGYSPMRPSGLTMLFGLGHIGQTSTVDRVRHFLITESTPGGLFSLMGVDGLVLGNHFRADEALLINQGWRMVRRTQEGTVLQRQEPLSSRIHMASSAIAQPSAISAFMYLEETPPLPERPVVLLTSDPDSV